jgi:hypothetical protein
MKAIKVFSSVVLLMLCMVSFGQSTTTSPKTSVYYVQVPHTAEQCLKTLDDMKGKGDAFLSKFEFGRCQATIVPMHS